MQRLVTWVPLLAITALVTAMKPWQTFTQAQDAIAQTQQGSKQSQSQIAQVVPGSIYDGDTLRVNLNGTETRIRLCGIDAPERDQPLGIAARDHLRSLINRGNGTIVVVPVEQDQYGRTVAELYIQPRSGLGYQAGEEIAVNAQMVADGYAYHYAQYSGDCPNGGLLAAIESQAQAARRGVWSHSNSVRPWDYRRSR
jgi:endonuclease YncB( thermonuclease family)